MKKKSTSRSPKAFSLPRRISLPSSSLSFSGLGSIPLSERRQAFVEFPFGAPGLFWFEHRLKHSPKGPSYAMRSIQKKSLWEAAGMTKRGRFPVLHWKKDLREERLLLGFFLPRPPPPGPPPRGRLAKRKKTEGGGAASYSRRENFRIGEAFGTGDAFISLAEAETIQSIRGFGEPKKKFDLIHR